MTEPLAVVFQRRAAREIEAADEWWRENRMSAPDLFVSELDTMLSAIALMPTLGLPAKAERAPGLRRVTAGLPGGHFHRNRRRPGPRGTADPEH